MFSYFRSENSKLRSAAKNWLYLGRKVYDFRRDQLSDAEVSELARRIDGLRSQLNVKPADAGALKLSIEALEAQLKEVGGAFYPQSTLSENVDFVLYFLIIYLGFTAFFIKPFAIPTNSMWPTYNGMTSEVWTEENPAPGLASRAFRLIANGSVRYRMTAPESGELLIPVLTDGARILGLHKATVGKRRYLVVPGEGVGYWFEVGGVKTVFKVPTEFDLELPMPIGTEQDRSVLREAWFPEEASFWEGIQKRIVEGGVDRRERVVLADGRSAEVIWVKSGLRFAQGETALSFDIHAGDRLLVDRISYHFARPKVGDGFVFLTGNIENLSTSPEQHYIKRLAGTPGDRLRIEGSALIVNDAPASGSAAFGRNGGKEYPYAGYFDRVEQTAPGFGGLLLAGEEITVPQYSYVVLGDNSGYSYDSRGWGYVTPGTVIVGKPVFIFYPFTRRFGLAE